MIEGMNSNATLVIAGTASDASGIASATVNSEPANGTLDWGANVTLTVGENTITVIATDGAGLTATTRSPPQTPRSRSKSRSAAACPTCAGA